MWLVVVQEPDPPPGHKPLEWLLWTSLPTTTAQEADERIATYRARWRIEDYHQCLKTGCRIEARHQREQADLERVLGLLGPVAAYLLALRHEAREAPKALAQNRHPTAVVQIVAHLDHREPEQMTCKQFWWAIAKQGGYLARCHDGPPGWKTLWAGWRMIQTLLDGMHLAFVLVPARE